jgi:membrane protease YdiL (CAAX protease family)
VKSDRRQEVQEARVLPVSLDPRDGECLRRSQLFAELGDEAFGRLAGYACRVHFEAEEILFESKDEPDRFYVVLEGRCEVVEHDSSTAVLATIEPGACVGELSLGSGPRSATVRVAAGTTLAAFPIETTLELVIAKHEAERQRVSVFITYLIPLLCGFMFATEWLGSMTATAPGTTIITLPIIVVMMLALIHPIRSLELPWAAYGITGARWQESLRDGLLFAIPVVLAATAFKFTLVSLSPTHAGLPSVDCVDTLTRELGSTPAAIRHFVVFNLAYVVVVVPLQELIARGLLQGLMERFIASKHRTLLAILISNLIFGVFHLYLSTAAAVATIVLGVYLGSIYARTRNLIGVCVAHAIIGTWVLTVVRLQATLF